MTGREVQSDPKWNDLELQLDDPFDFQYLDNIMSVDEDPFGTQIQYQMNQQLSSFQDLFMFPQKPF